MMIFDTIAIIFKSIHISINKYDTSLEIGVIVEEISNSEVNLHGKW